MDAVPSGGWFRRRVWWVQLVKALRYLHWIDWDLAPGESKGFALTVKALPPGASEWIFQGFELALGPGGNPFVSELAVGSHKLLVGPVRASAFAEGEPLDPLELARGIKLFTGDSLRVTLVNACQEQRSEGVGAFLLRARNARGWVR